MIHHYYDTQHGLYGFKNAQGAIVVPPAFDRVGSFSGGVAEVRQGDRWGAINAEGVLVVPVAYDQVFVSYRGWVQAQQGNTHYLFTPGGEQLLQLDDLLYWHYPEEGLIRVKRPGGWGAVTLQGAEAIPCRYASLGPCQGGRLSYYEGEHWGWLDAAGRVLVPARFDEVGQWNDRWWWGRHDGAYGLYDAANNPVTGERWLKIVPPVNGLSAVKTPEGWKYLEEDLSTRLQLPPLYDWVELFRGDLAAVKRNGLWGFINPAGAEVIPPAWERVDPFSEGLAAVRQGGLWGYIDTTGHLVIPCRYHSAHDFNGGRAYVTDYYDSWYINPQGQQITKEEPLDY